ncbi:hypothetical protein E2562_018605 [Oryza meyeriana var. granulata]|uniref:Uncharacterized protein n=1 Tax=Oryza meyeriana var. granulata TaxID=110450 RepID=A0A6G1F9K2_9ORYZ|nr:hypothetical protein E2562_018605 [Oryza meyeriana var. granulata]
MAQNKNIEVALLVGTLVAVDAAAPFMSVEELRDVCRDECSKKEHKELIGNKQYRLLHHLDQEY